MFIKIKNIIYNKITIYSTVKDSKEALNNERKRQKRYENRKFYIIDIGIDSLTGKRKQKKREFTTKKEAENALTMLLSEVHNGIYVEPSKATLW
ncbi:Arm DNA-binding domain-containing protein [Bacillus cereus]|nr:Arm DNA-binding domain-containing protein [Bacillus cereus]